MTTLENITRESFDNCTNKRFVLRAASGELELEQKTAEDIGTGAGKAQRQPFSVIFKGPAEPLLAQGTYPLENEELGTLELFLVPVASDDQGTEYEAVFA